MKRLDNEQIDSLLASASGNVSYQSNYARTTATVADGRCAQMEYASDFLNALIDAERKAAYVAPKRVIVSGKRTEPYNGPFPRGKHSQRCAGCVLFGQYNAVACYKQKCTIPQLTSVCVCCQRHYAT